MKEAAGVGKIVKGVNTTPDVQPGETERQAKKLFPMNKGGKPKSLGVKGATPNVAFNLGLTEDEMTTIQRAEQFAQEAHKNHKRKYTGDPYYVHLDEVRRIVKAAGGSEDMQAAALLHDTVEDTATTSQDIMKEFGPSIARLVIDLTDISKPEDGNRATRKAMDRDKLSMASSEAQTIKYADLISNGKDIAKNDPKFAKVYHAEKADLLRVMRKGDQNLRKAAIDMLPDDLRSIAMENMSVTGTERRRLEKKKGIEVGTPEWFKHWFDLPYLRDDVTPETKEAPAGTYFTKSGNLVKGTLTKSAKDKGARQTDPKDSQRSKVPAVTQYNEGKRVARKKGQKANSKKHSDLYTDENPKGTIHGLKFATVKDAEASVSKIKGSGKKHAHKIQAAIAMEQRAKAAGKKSAAAVYRRYINAMKKKTKKMNENLKEKYDDIGQKIYKGNTTRVVNTPVADKNISVADKRIAKFSQQRDMDDMTYKGSKITAPGTNQTIAKAKSNINRAYNKQDKIDQRQGAGQSYITKGKPVKFSSSDNVQLNMSEGVQKVDIQQLEKFADKLFGKVGIDVEFTKHFMDRVNDVRNQKPITMSELTRLFKQEYKRWGRPIAQLGPDSEAVMKDLQTDINLPFVLKWDSKNNELDLVAKTVMRKADFKTSNKEFPVEDTNVNEVINKDFFKTTIADIASTLGIDTSTALALAKQESDFRQNVVGDTDRKNKAYGLFQIRLPALKDVNRIYKTNYTIDDVANDPKINTEVGLKYFLAMKDTYGAENDAQAFRGYNGGPGAIKGTNKGANKYSQSVQATQKSLSKQNKDLNPSRYYDKIDNPQKITPPVPKPKPKPQSNTGTIQDPYANLKKFQGREPYMPNIDQKPVIQPPTPKPTQVNYNQLAKASGISDPNKIFPGQTINLPTGATYTVKSGDTLSKIAKNYNKGLIGENVPKTNKPGTIGQHINWAGKNKPEQTKKIATRGTQDPQNWWQSMLQKGKNLFDDEQIDLKKKFEISDELRQLDSVFKKGKYSIRIVGGAVRDLALGKTPKDIDLATDATPQEMQSIFDSAGIKHIPTGIEHGTITAVLNGEPYEITTLRADKETDGRRAKVEFVRSWEEDAKRRDLTYNAMSMDFDGNLYDYHGGMDDLQDKVTKFVGDPEERIKEDYLRTLRYFRFQGRLDTPTFDRETMQAIASNTDGLKQLSVERVWMEMQKILGGGNIKQILGAMQKTGVLDAIGLNAKPSQQLMDGGDPIINLARITDDQSIGPRWKMSNEEKSKLGFLISEKGKTHDKKWYTDQMVDGFNRTQLDALARYNNQDDMIAYIKSFKAPDFPVDGNDLINIGHERGPKIGKTLQALRNQWKQGNFSASKEELLKNITESVSSFTDPNFEVEWDEAKRYPEFVKIGKAKWIELAKKGKPIDVNNALANKIENTEAGEENRHEFDNLEEPKKERFRKAVKAGTVELPIIARYSDGYLELVAGNTRLTGMMREFGEGKAWIFDVPDEIAVLGEDQKQIKTKNNPDGFTIDLMVNGKQVGQYTHAREDDIVRNQAEIFPEYRNKGYGTMLLLAAIKTADNLGLDFEEDTQSLTPAMSRIYDELADSGMIYGGNGAWAISPSGEAELEDFLNENFADGKKPGRKGLSKRVGIPKGATLAQLEKIAKNSTGERRRMAQWQLNMRRGKNKSK